MNARSISAVTISPNGDPATVDLPVVDHSHDFTVCPGPSVCSIFEEHRGAVAGLVVGLGLVGEEILEPLGRNQ